MIWSDKCKVELDSNKREYMPRPIKTRNHPKIYNKDSKTQWWVFNSLEPIEHMWKELKTLVDDRKSKILQEFSIYCQEEQQNVKEIIFKLYSSIACRFEALVWEQY